MLVLPARAAIRQKSRHTQTAPRPAWFSGKKQSRQIVRRLPPADRSQPALTVLTSGVPQPFSLPAVNGPTLFDEGGYRIDVPAGAGRLQVSLFTEN
jgi:hypothetical protein